MGPDSNGGTRITELKWAIGTQRVGSKYLEERRSRGERIHFKTVGRLQLPGVGAELAAEVIEGQWVLGRIAADPEVVALLRTRRRWSPIGPIRIDHSVCFQHRRTFTDYTMDDVSVGFPWFDSYGLTETKRAGRHINISVIGILRIAADVSPQLAEDVFGRIELAGVLVARREVRHRLKPKIVRSLRPSKVSR